MPTATNLLQPLPLTTHTHSPPFTGTLECLLPTPTLTPTSRQYMVLRTMHNESGKLRPGDTIFTVYAKRPQVRPYQPRRALETRYAPASSLRPS